MGKRIPWVPLIRKPKYNFYKIKFSLPKEIPNYYSLVLSYLIIFYIYSSIPMLMVNDFRFPVYGKTYFPGKENEIGLIYHDPSFKKNYLLEGVVFALLSFLAFIGLLMFREATKEPHNILRANNLQLLGTLLIIIAFITIEFMYYKKTWVPPPRNP